MTTVTCQRSRIVSPAGIVPIPSIHICCVPGFFPEDSRKTHGVWKRSGQHHARTDRGKKNGRRRRRCRDDGRPRRRPAIDFLSSSRVYDISPRFDTTRNLSACHACLSPGGTAGPPRAPARICLSERTPAGCCLDIVEKRRHRTAWNRPNPPWKDKNVYVGTLPVSSASQNY